MIFGNIEIKIRYRVLKWLKELKEKFTCDSCGYIFEPESKYPIIYLIEETTRSSGRFTYCPMCKKRIFGSYGSWHKDIESTEKMIKNYFCLSSEKEFKDLIDYMYELTQTNVF